MRISLVIDEVLTERIDGCNPLAVGSVNASARKSTSKTTSLDPNHQKMTGCLTKLGGLQEPGQVSLPA